MPEFCYARDRILDSLRYLLEEMKEFQSRCAPLLNCKQQCLRKQDKTMCFHTKCQATLFEKTITSAPAAASAITLV